MKNKNELRKQASNLIDEIWKMKENIERAKSLVGIKERELEKLFNKIDEK